MPNNRLMKNVLLGYMRHEGSSEKRKIAQEMD